MHEPKLTPEPHLARFGLAREPFADSPDENFFLLDSQRADLLNTLYHLTQQGDTPLLITGNKGSGKTSLINKFLAMGHNTWRYCLVQANAMMNPEQLLRHIADGFGIEPDRINFDNAIDSLRQRLVELHRSGLVAMLIIDDAEDLPAASLTVLMKLSELQDDGRSLLRMLLFGEAQISMVLASLDLGDMRQRIRHTLEMPALNERQTIDYLQYRLGVAGSAETMPLSRGQMKQVYRLSKGNPLQVNKLARAMLLECGDSGETGYGIRAILLAIGLLGVLGLAGYFLVEDLSTGDGQRASGETSTILELPPTRPVAPATTVTEPAPPAISQPAGEPQLNGQLPAVTAASTGEVAEQPATMASQPKNNDIIQEVNEKPSDLTSVSADWFNGLDPEHFTLQLIGSRNKATVEALQQQNSLGPHSAIVTTRHDNAPWYVLVYGSYPDKEAARAAISGLPAPLRQAGPWPRRIGDLQTSP